MLFVLVVYLPNQVGMMMDYSHYMLFCDLYFCLNAYADSRLSYPICPIAKPQHAWWMSTSQGSRYLCKHDPDAPKHRQCCAAVWSACHDMHALHPRHQSKLDFHPWAGGLEAVLNEGVDRVCSSECCCRCPLCKINREERIRLECIPLTFSCTAQ